MSQVSFHYRALDAQGAAAKGVLQAKSQEDAYRQIIASAKTFRAMNAQDARLASGTRLHIIRAGSNTRYRDLAARTPIDRHAEEQLRLLNDQYPKGEPRSGQLLKTVR